MLDFEYARDKNRIHKNGKYYFIKSKYFYGSPLKCEIVFENNKNEILVCRGVI